MNKIQKQLLILNDIASKGNVAIVKYLQELEDKMDAMDKSNKENKLPPEIVAKIKTVKGERGEPGKDGETPVIDYESIIREVIANIRLPKDGKDGKDAVIDYPKLVAEAAKRIKVPEVDYSRVVEDVLALIKLPDAIEGKAGKDGSPDTGDQIVDKINNSNSQIDASKIKNLPQNKPYIVGGGSMGIAELVAGTGISIDNSNIRYPVITSTGSGSGTVTSASVVSANGFAGSVATSTTTPAITLTTTINSPVLAGNGTAISAATTTGTGSTVVLSGSPALTTPSIAAINVSGGILTLPTGASDTLVSKNSTDTLTNKTLTTPTITKPVMSATNPTAQTYTPSAAGTATLDLSLSNQHYITMPAGNITVALSNATNNQIFIVSITQDGTGSRTVTWFTTIRWAGGSAPTLTTTASKRDVFGFIRTGSNTYDGFIIGQNI